MCSAPTWTSPNGPANERPSNGVSTPLSRPCPAPPSSATPAPPVTSDAWADLAVQIAHVLDLPEDQVLGLATAASIHDLGKIAIPAEILSKSGRLSAAEYALVREHADAGYELVRGIDFPWPVAEMIRQHHERLDGSGYPRGLTDDAILLEAKIIAVADTVEAMTTHRPYRPAVGQDAALDAIAAGRGTLFDADTVDACVASFRDLGYSLPDR